jgi:hypothetical protein
LAEFCECTAPLANRWCAGEEAAVTPPAGGEPAAPVKKEKKKKEKKEKKAAQTETGDETLTAGGQSTASPTPLLLLLFMCCCCLTAARTYLYMMCCTELHVKRKLCRHLPKKKVWTVVGDGRLLVRLLIIALAQCLCILLFHSLCCGEHYFINAAPKAGSGRAACHD